MRNKAHEDMLHQQILREENCASLYTRFAGIARDPNLAQTFHEFAHQAQEHSNQLRSIVRERGGVVDGVIQNRATSDSAPIDANALDSQADDRFTGVPTAPTGADMPPVRGTDEDMIADALLTIKTMSDSYRRAATQTADEGVCAALIGMRRDEDRQRERLARLFEGADDH